ncbi:MAG: uroporphyrinogen decarboxylase family protein [Candidatus Bathyarchaeia archaeon]
MVVSKTYVEGLLDPEIYERIIAAANFEEPDRVPIWDYIDNWKVVRYFAGSEKDLLKAIVKVYHGLGIDLCRGFGSVYEPRDEGKITFDSGIERRISGLTLWNNPPIKCMEELKSYHIEAPSKEAIRERIEANKKYCEAFAPYTMWVPGCNVGFDVYYSITNLSLFSVAMRKIPGEIKRIMLERNEANLQYVRAIAKERISPLFFIGEDIAYKNRTMFSTQYLKNEFIPLLKRLCDPLKDSGIKIIFHSDGFLPDDLIDALVEAGIDGLNPIEPVAGMDIGHLKEKYYGKLILVGNLDCSQILPLGSPEKIVEETKKLIEIASPGGGHFIGSSSEITPSTPLANVLTFYRTIHEYGKSSRRNWIF